MPVGIGEVASGTAKRLNSRTEHRRCGARCATPDKCQRWRAKPGWRPRPAPTAVRDKYPVTPTDVGAHWSLRVAFSRCARPRRDSARQPSPFFCWCKRRNQENTSTPASQTFAQAGLARCTPRTRSSQDVSPGPDVRGLPSQAPHHPCHSRHPGRVSGLADRCTSSAGRLPGRDPARPRLRESST